MWILMPSTLGTCGLKEIHKGPTMATPIGEALSRRVLLHDQCSVIIITDKLTHDTALWVTGNSGSGQWSWGLLAVRIPDSLPEGLFWTLQGRSEGPGSYHPGNSHDGLNLEDKYPPASLPLGGITLKWVLLGLTEASSWTEASWTLFWLSCVPCQTCPFPYQSIWDHVPNKPPALKSLYPVLLLGEPNIKHCG